MLQGPDQVPAESMPKSSETVPGHGWSIYAVRVPKSKGFFLHGSRETQVVLPTTPYQAIVFPTTPKQCIQNMQVRQDCAVRKLTMRTSEAPATQPEVRKCDEHESHSGQEHSQRSGNVHTRISELRMLISQTPATQPELRKCALPYVARQQHSHRSGNAMQTNLRAAIPHVSLGPGNVP